MKQYKLFQAPLMSFCPGNFYRDVGLRWTGTGFAYLLLLITICWIPKAFKAQHAVTGFVEKTMPPIISQVPEIRITKGEVSINAAQPHNIINPDTGKVLIILDTTGSTASPTDPETLMLVTKTEVKIRKDDVETRSLSLEKIQDFTLNQENITAWLNMGRKYGVLFFFPFAVSLAFFFKIAQMLIYAAIGLMFARWHCTSVSYATLLRLSAMAVTPSIIIATLLTLTGLSLPYSGTLFFAATMTYLFLGVKALSQSQEAPGLPAAAN